MIPKINLINCLRGVFIGDALGLPVECMSPSEIRQQFGHIDHFVANRKHKYKSIAKRAPGTISDDSQLTLAMMDGIKRQNSISIEDIKESHYSAFNGKWGIPVGWGKSTRTAIRQGMSPIPSKQAAGNGPVIKIAPLAIWHACHFGFVDRNELLLEHCKQITILSHGDPRCIVAAYCQSQMIIRALTDNLPLFPLKIAQIIFQDARFAESKINAGWDTPEQEWPPLTLRARLKIGTDRLSDRIMNVLCANFSMGETIFDDGENDFYPSHASCLRQGYALKLDTGFVSTSICTEKSSYIMNSYPLVAYCASKYLPFRDALFAIMETVNAGADADSNGSMIGAIAGACVGLIHDKFFNKLIKHKMLNKEIDDFIQRIKK